MHDRCPARKDSNHGVHTCKTLTPPASPSLQHTHASSPPKAHNVQLSWNGIEYTDQSTRATSLRVMRRAHMQPEGSLFSWQLLQGVPKSTAIIEGSM
eukprot:scaffold177265_cov23-Tisochrysis_lutea.AAC.1